MTRGTTNTNVRGSSSDRRQRKLYLLAKFGDGITTKCCFCDDELTYDTITVDRIVPGIEGGKYTRDNIRPACGTCNSRDGNDIMRRRMVTAASGSATETRS